MVNELIPLFGAMVITFIVMVGLIFMIRDWMKKRDDLMPH
jgi:hypothetical protein